MKMPPIAQLIACALLAWLLALHIPVSELKFSIMLPFLSGFAGLTFLVPALLGFRRQKTTVNPMKPDRASSLVVSGVYRITRNPMYVGMAFLLLAWCFWLGALGAFLSVPVFIGFMTILQIRPEEAALGEIFGEDYRQYQNRVSRWLLF